MKQAVTPPRKLHTGHFAFMRALAQGLDERASWDRYLKLEGEHTDLRTVRCTIAWIRDAFAAAARREHRPGIARLILLDADRFAADASLPSLAEFAEARVIERQLEALRWLQDLVAQDPRPGDSVVAWLNPSLAGRLERVGVPTLFTLVERINGIGARWWVQVGAGARGGRAQGAALLAPTEF